MEHQHPGEQPGTELEARREMLPAELVAAPNRAGAIVAEFVNSIVEEAQARALEMIRAAANQDDAGQRDALERADRMRARIDVMAEELADAVEALRQESERLASLREETTFVALTGASPGPDTGELAALEQVAAGLERAEAEPEAEEPATEEPATEEPDEDRLHEVEVVSTHDDEDEPEAHEDEDDGPGEEAVEGHAEEDFDDEEATAIQEPDARGVEEPAPQEVEEPAAEEPAVEEPVASASDTEPGPEELLAQQSALTAEVDAVTDDVEEPAPEQPTDEVEASEEPEVAASEEAEPRSEEQELAEDQERFARMNDVELARAYSDALDQMDLQPAESERGARLLRYAGSALGEALTRPTFADIGQGAPALENVPRMGRRRRQRAESINTLRRACAQAIEEMSSEEALR